MLTKMLMPLIAGLLLSLDGCLMIGCIVKGHREWTMRVMGNEFLAVEDHVHNDETGKPVFHATVDSVGEWLLGELIKSDTISPSEAEAYKQQILLMDVEVVTETSTTELETKKPSTE